jgi:hypothetical protein
MTRDLIIGVSSLVIGAGLLFVAWPNKYGESPPFLQFYSAPMIYPAVVEVFLVLGIIELVVWAFL